MSNKELLEVVSDFTTGLLKHAKVKHAGNCLTMSQILRYYLAIFYKVPTELVHAWVKEEKDIINHYFLKMNNGIIIDATASQFKGMPKVYIGEMPNNYLLTIK